MKLFGLLLVFLSVASVGFIRAEEYAKKDKELTALTEFMYFIKKEISLYLTPQNRIYEKYSHPILEENGFLPLLRELGKKGCETPLSTLLSQGSIRLDGDAVNAMMIFADGFGAFSSEEECRRCDRAIKELEEICKKKKEETLKKTKLCRSIFGMIGIGLVILLW